MKIDEDLFITVEKLHLADGTEIERTEDGGWEVIRPGMPIADAENLAQALHIVLDPTPPAATLTGRGGVHISATGNSFAAGHVTGPVTLGGPSY